MAWLTDVAPYTVIQSAWGNSVRDRIVQTFTDMNEANAHLAALPDGALVNIGTTLYIKRGGAWKLLLPTVIAGTVFGATSPGQTNALVAQITVPAGYSLALVQYMGRSIQDFAGGGNGYDYVEIKLFRSNGGVQLAGVQEHVPNWINNRAVHAIGAVSACNPNGDVFTVTANNISALATRTWIGNDGSQTFGGIFLP